MRIFLTALLALLALPAAAGDLPTIHLRVAGGLGQTDQFKEFEEPFWTKQLSEASGGKITAEVSPYDQDGMSGAELLQFTRLGAIAIGDVPLAQVASEDPEVAGVDLAGLNGDIHELRRSIAAYPADDDQGSIASATTSMCWRCGPTRRRSSSATGARSTGLADLKGVKVRVASAAHGDFVRGLGGIDITTPYNALMDALKNHVADCAITGAISGYRLGLQRVTTHVDPVTDELGSQHPHRQPHRLADAGRAGPRLSAPADRPVDRPHLGLGRGDIARGDRLRHRHRALPGGAVGSSDARPRNPGRPRRSSARF